MSNQDLPLSPVRPTESAQMDPCLSSGHTMEDAELAECVSGTTDALCSVAEQAKNVQGYVVADDMAAADSRDSFGTVDHTHKDTPGAIVDPGTVNFLQPPAPNGTTDNEEEMEAQKAQVPTSANIAIEPMLEADNARQKHLPPRRHGEECEPFGLTSVHLSHQFGFP